ncbi:MAG: O-antigen ligase family protein [Clostridia bacterium]|nr:O-antigen ligase family protein [Clostridia bacterium]
MNRSLLKTEQTVYDIYVLLMFLVFPLFILPAGYKNITGAKYAFFAAATLLFAAFRLVFAIKAGKKGCRFSLSPSEICVVLFFIASCLSAVLSPFGASVLRGMGRQEGLYTVTLYCRCFFILSRRRFKPLYVLFLEASSLIFALITLVQLLDKNPFGFYPSGYYYYAAADVYTASFAGTIGNVGVASIFISVCVPLFFASYLDPDTKNPSLPFVSALLFFILLYTDADAGKVAVAAALSYVAVACGNAENFKKLCRFLSLHACAAALNELIARKYVYPRIYFSLSFSARFFAYAFAAALLFGLSFIKIKRVKLFIVISLAVIILASLVFVYFYRGESGVLFEAREILHGNVDESFGSSRIKIWKECLRLFKERPLFGGGPDTLRGRIGTVFERTSDISGELIRRSVDSAHNEYLNVLVNTGIFGFLPFLSLVFFSLSSKEAVPKAAFLGYAVCIFFNFSVCITAPFFWMFAAFLSSKKD